MVAERVGNAKFGNIHQSRLSIPGDARKRNKELEKRWRRRSVPKSPHFFMKRWSGVGCWLPSLSGHHKNTFCFSPTTPACTGAAHRRRCGEKEQWGQIKKRTGSTAGRQGNDEQMMDRADVEHREKRSSDESVLGLKKSVTGLSLH